MNTKYPIVDVFAGAGGLGEGFLSVLDQQQRRRFTASLSIEAEANAFSTLTVRHFFNAFNPGAAPDAYYDLLAGTNTVEQLFRMYPVEAAHAFSCACQLRMGPAARTEIRNLLNARLNQTDKWALIGGPPCQAYSLVGRARMMNDPNFWKDSRHTLYLEYLQIIADHQPPVFVMENVKGLLSATIAGASAIQRIMSDLRCPSSVVNDAPSDLTYRLYSLSESSLFDEDIDPRLFVVRAEEFGIPQARHRMFILGIRGDLHVRPNKLVKCKPPTVIDTIGMLPAVRSGLSRSDDTPEAWLDAICGYSGARLRKDDVPASTSSTVYSVQRQSHSVLQSLHDPRITALNGHNARSHMASDLRRYHFAAAYAETFGISPKLGDFPTELLPDHSNVELGRSGSMFSDRFRVQLRDRPATTVTSHISKDGHYFIHYDPAQCRSLTVREAARLQTFPDNYYFSGSRTSQYHQIGNAVPPQLAKQIGEIVADVLDQV